MSQRTCSVGGCDKPRHARGWCASHYDRWRWRGDPNPPPLRPLMTERFWSKVDRSAGPDGCWLWTASRDRHGYGYFGVGQTLYKAHRMAWFLTYRRWPVQVLDHLCRNPPCVNPDHLEDVSNKVNLLRGNGWSGRHAQKTHCPQGHPYSGDNLVMYKGARLCRTCREALAIARRPQKNAQRRAKRAEAKARGMRKSAWDRG